MYNCNKSERAGTRHKSGSHPWSWWEHFLAILYHQTIFKLNLIRYCATLGSVDNKRTRKSTESMWSVHNQQLTEPGAVLMLVMTQRMWNLNNIRTNQANEDNDDTEVGSDNNVVVDAHLRIIRINLIDGQSKYWKSRLDIEHRYYNPGKNINFFSIASLSSTLENLEKLKIRVWTSL